MKMPEKIDYKFFAPCGMNCMVCYKHLKDKKACQGCLVNDANKPEHCRACTIKDCVHSKGLRYCYECEDFPCQKVKNLERSYKKRYKVSLVEQSYVVKSRGLDAFMENEVERWICDDCGGVVNLHDGICSDCSKVKE